MSARRCRASSMLRAMATPPCGCGPVVWNPASYRHPVTTCPGVAACPGVGGACLVVVVVVGVAAARLRCWSMIGSVPSPRSSARRALTRRASGAGGAGVAWSVRCQVGVPLGWHDPDGSGRGSGGGPGSWEGQGPRPEEPSAPRSGRGCWVRRSRSIGVSGAAGAAGSSGGAEADRRSRGHRGGWGVLRASSTGTPMRWPPYARRSGRRSPFARLRG